MPRNISSALQTKLDTDFGTEPINIVEVQWDIDGQRSVYSDRDIDGYAAGRITELSGLDFVINVNDGSDSAEITIALSDVDGDLKQVLDNTDIHKRDVWIYQWFDGISTNDKALIFQGEINSPIIWNEGDRTLRFTVISKIESAEIGFSIEEGQFQNPSQELIGTPWPLKFGTTINVPAVKFTSPVRGILSTGFGISDFTLPYKLEASQEQCEEVFTGYRTEYNAFGSLLIIPQYQTDPQCEYNNCVNNTRYSNQISKQAEYELNSIIIIDGEKFPQNETITLRINGATVTGSFEGNVFHITNRRHPVLVESGLSIESWIEAGQEENKNYDGCGSIEKQNEPYTDQRRKELVSYIPYKYDFDSIPDAGFFWAAPGTEVVLELDEPLTFVTNILPEEIKSVSAYRDFNGIRKLVIVPKEYYTVRFTDFGSYTCTEILLDKPLDQISEGWETELYVTSISTVGPNTVDILEWLIETYTDFEIDSTSFNEVREYLENYPSDFPLLDRKDILQTLQEICFQCRCAIYLRNKTFYLKYLPKVPEIIDTISEDDVDSNTLELFHTNTEDLVTKMLATWKRDYSVDVDNKVVLRHNVEKYGIQEETFDFYIYNEFDYVYKSATFWMVRKANTWRLLRFQTPIHKLILETFDGVNLSLPDFSPNIIYGLVQKANYNSDSRSIDFEIWTPVKSGTQVTYDFAHPKEIEPERIWPTEEEREKLLVGSGSAPGFDTFAPSGHPLSIEKEGFQNISFGNCASQGQVLDSLVTGNCGSDHGDSSPSDENDEKVEKELENETPPDNPVEPDDVNIGRPVDEDFGGPTRDEELERRLSEAEKRAATAKALAESANEAAGGDGGGNQDPADPDNPKKDLPPEENLPPGTCKHKVNVFYAIPTAVFQTGEIGPQETGFLGSSQAVGQEVYTFGTCCEAEQFATVINQQHQERQNSESYEDGGGPYAINANVQCVVSADCSGVPPCEEQERDEEGNPIGKRPIPQSYEQKNVDPEGPQIPDVWPEIIPDLDPSVCAPPEGECD